MSIAFKGQSIRNRDEFGYLSRHSMRCEERALEEHYKGNDTLCWLMLLQKEYYRYGIPGDRTNRQKEAQKLWQNSGTIARAIANVRDVIKILNGYGMSTSAGYLQKMEWELHQARTYNKQMFQTISHRIKND